MGAAGTFFGGDHLQQCGRVVSCFKCQHQRYLNNSIVSKLGSCAVCSIHFMCHHELRPTSVRHSFSFLNNSLGPACGKHYQKITIPISRVRPVTATILDGFLYIRHNRLLAWHSRFKIRERLFNKVPRVYSITTHMSIYQFSIQMSIQSMKSPDLYYGRSRYNKGHQWVSWRQ